MLRGTAWAATAMMAPGCASDEPPLPPPPPEPVVFRHGVASGDPLGDAVILWTRVTAIDPADVVEVSYLVALDVGLTAVVAEGSVTTDGDRDFTVKIDVTDLSPATTYYYRFAALGEQSAVGRTRTAPSAAVDRLRFAVASCASYAHGHFNAYRHLAQRADLDLVLHLGDYIYEYGNDQYGGVRLYEPAHEIISLDDYRLRYAHYRRDPDLQAVHRQHPFAVIWDDHESANNSWAGGAGNHDAGEGSWDARKAASRQAYFEWLPIRDSDDGLIQRVLHYGGLVDVILLDTRLCCRDEPAESGSDPLLAEEARSLLGAEQEAWLADRVTTSGAQWKLVAQQVMMGQLPQFTNTDQWDGYPFARQRFFETLRAGNVEDVVVLTGDIHSSWAMDLTDDPLDPNAYDPKTGEGSVAVELVTPGITSQGFPDQLADVADGLVMDNPHMKWVELTKRGYLVLDVTPARLQGAWYFADTVLERVDGESLGGVVEVAAGVSHVVVVESPAPAPDGPPLAP
jgi:alkaline phosphatase D